MDAKRSGKRMISLRNGAMAVLGAASLCATASAVPFYYNGWCFTYLEPIKHNCIELVIVDDACLKIEGVATGMGDLQSHYSFLNVPSSSQRGVGPQDVYAIAVGVSDDAVEAAAHDGAVRTWESQIVSRVAWDAGFQFPGSAGLWTPPDTTGTFDSFFGTEFDQAAVFWASTSSNTGALLPTEGMECYAIPQRITDNEIPALTGFVALGDSAVVQNGQWANFKIQAYGLDHQVVDQAMMSVTPGGKLKISNLGSSGCDGFSIDLGEGEGWESQLTLPASLAGSGLKVDVRGQIGAVSDGQILAMCLDGALLPTGQNVITNFDFTGIGSTATHVELYDPNGDLVSEFNSTNPYCVIVVEPGIPSTRISAVCEPQGDQGILDLTSPTTVIDDATGTQYGNVQEVRVRALNIATPPDFVSSVVVTGTNISEMTVENEQVQMFGLHFETVDQNAKNEPKGGKIKISNLGSSGCDGFSIDIGGTDPGEADVVQELNMNWDPLIECGITPPPPGCDREDAHIELHATGVVGAATGHDLGWLRVEQDTLPGDPNTKLISADYSAVGTMTMFIEVLQNGQPVFQQGGVLPGGVARTADWPKGCGKGGVDLGGTQTACFTVCWPTDVPITILGGPTLLGNELRVLAESPSGAYGGLETFSVLAAEMREIVLNSAVAIPFPCPGDANGDNVVDLTDLNLVLFNFGNAVPPGTNGDVDGSGTVDLTDLNLVLFNFGRVC